MIISKELVVLEFIDVTLEILGNLNWSVFEDLIIIAKTAFKWISISTNIENDASDLF